MKKEFYCFTDKFAESEKVSRGRNERNSIAQCIRAFFQRLRSFFMI
jgi:hypothetical protein